MLHSHICPLLYRSQPVSCFHKVFPLSIHWAQSRPQLVLHFLASFPPSHAPLYTRRARVSIYVSFITSFSFTSPQTFAAFVLSSPRSLPPTSSHLSVPLRSVPPRFLSVEHTTVSLSGFSPGLHFHLIPIFTFLACSVWIRAHRSQDRIVLFVHIYNRTERREQRGHQGWVPTKR